MPRTHPARHRALAAAWLEPVVLAALMLLLQAAGAPLRAVLRFERVAVLDGQVWRLFSAHFVHLGWTHCLLNLAALALCVLLSRGQPPGRSWLATTAALAAGVGTLLLAAAPAVPDYVGFSGVVYGLFVCVLGPPARRGDRVALVLLLLLLARLAWQLAMESPDAQLGLIGGTVVAQAHLFGVGCGLVWVLWQAVREQRCKLRNHKR